MRLARDLLPTAVKIATPNITSCFHIIDGFGSKNRWPILDRRIPGSDITLTILLVDEAVRGNWMAGHGCRVLSAAYHRIADLNVRAVWGPLRRRSLLGLDQAEAII